MTMMYITYSPQQMKETLAYSIDSDAIIATMDGQTDTFDFSAMPDGKATEITSTLDPRPVRAAKRVDGVLHVTLLRAIPARPQPGDYNTEQDFETALNAWKALWTDGLEVAIGE